MALRANGIAQRPRELRRIHDRRAHFAVARAALCDAHMRPAGTMTALASRAFRQVRREHLRHRVHVASGRNVGIRVVAEEAFAPHESSDAVVVGAIEYRRHAPRLLLRVPRDRKLKELAARRPIEVDARSMSGTEDPVDLLLDLVDA